MLKKMKAGKQDRIRNNLLFYKKSLHEQRVTVFKGDIKAQAQFKQMEKLIDDLLKKEVITGKEARNVLAQISKMLLKAGNVNSKKELEESIRKGKK